MTQKQGEDKAAALPPAQPTESGWHPAHQSEDPGLHDYENGDTSKWKEDVAQPPYPEGKPPAQPSESGWHPAEKAAADQIRVAATEKAAKCIRLAEAMLPPGTDTAAIEDQALTFMDMADTAIDQSLSRLAADEEEEEEVDEGKKAETQVTASDQKIAELTSLVQSLAASVQGLMTAKKAEVAPAAVETPVEKKAEEVDSDEALLKKMLAEEAARPDPDEALLQQMLAEEKAASDPDEVLLQQMLAEETAGKKAEIDPDEALLQQMLAEEEDDSDDDSEDDSDDDSGESDDDAGKKAEEVAETGKAAEEADKAACGEMADMGLDDLLAEPEEEDMLDMGMAEDPMGLMSDEVPYPEDDSVLSAIFAEEARSSMGLESDSTAADTINKAAAQTPRPRKASKGPKTVGAQVRTASADVDLEGLWETKPDISQVFS